MITGYIRGQELSLAHTVIAADTINYITAQFLFQTADWDGLIKVAHFSNGLNAEDVELVNDEIPANAGLNLTVGTWQVSVTGHAISDGVLTKRITTTVSELTVKPSGVQSGEPLPNVASMGEQILGEVESLRAEMNEMLGKVKNERDGSFIKLWAGTEAQYSAATKNSDTIYLVGMLGGDNA